MERVIGDIGGMRSVAGRRGLCRATVSTDLERRRRGDPPAGEGHPGPGLTRSQFCEESSAGFQAKPNDSSVAPTDISP